MTTVAWDGASLASDSRAASGTRSHSTRKIERLPDGTLFGFAGYLSAYPKVRNWAAGGCVPEDRPKIRPGSEFILVKPDKTILVYEDCKDPIEVTDKIAAIGSGAEYALGALACGASAHRAVEVAALFDPATAGPVVILDL